MNTYSFFSITIAAITLLIAATPTPCQGCACGCGVFDVATSTMLPEGPGGMAFLECDYQNQNHNWSGTSQAPSADNPDKDIRTAFFSTGLQYMFNRDWGAELELPYDQRHFQTTGGPDGTDPVTLNWSALGDIRLRGIYTGFSPDLSAGLTFGVKLPSGDYTHNDAFGDIDRDSEIGTGSTDLLFGGFFRHAFARNPDWTWYAQLLCDQPVSCKDQYRPGAEADGAVGIYYRGWGDGGVRIAPVAQAIVSGRLSDSGSAAANPVASGYRRLLLSPGLELQVSRVSLYADVEVPAYQNFTGNQLAAPALFKVIASWMF